MKVVIIPGLTLPEISDADLVRIREAGGGADVAVASLEQAMQVASDADVILGIINRALFLQCKRVRWIQSISSGVDMFFFKEFIESDVVLTSEKGLVGEHLADHAFGLLLTLSRQLKTAILLGPDSWNHRPALRRQEFELTGLTMGLYGFGGTGKAIARRASAFGMHVLALDREPVSSTSDVEEVWGLERFDKLLSESDIVAVCCPLTLETRGIFDRVAFAKMRRTAYLVNVTRGEVMVEPDLIDALNSRVIAGAALDVTPTEPLNADNALWHMPNVVLTPHTAGASQFRARRNLERFIDNLARFRDNRPLLGLIDKDLGY